MGPEQLIKFLEGLSHNAGRLILKYQKNFKIVKQKDMEDVATSADIVSEKYIISEIRKKYPDHSILSEESGEKINKSDYKWIIDPLDGTKEFVRHIPLFNVSIALEYKGNLIASSLYRPSENTLYSAALGIGAFKNGEKIKVSNKTKLQESFVYCYLPSHARNQDKYDWAFEKLKEIGKKVYRLRALADENTALCWLAQGGCEAYVNLSNPPKRHDIATGLTISSIAGAIIDTKICPVLVCNNKSIYNSLKKIIR